MLRTSRIFAAALLALLASACAESDPLAEEAARAATLPWLEKMDAGAYDECWQAAAPMFRERVSLEAWGEQAVEARSPLGALRGRKLAATTYVTNPWGAPAGRYVLVVYASDWEAGDIHETLSMQESPAGEWLLAGYHVKQRRSGDGEADEAVGEARVGAVAGDAAEADGG